MDRPPVRPRQAPRLVDGVGEGRDHARPGHGRPQDRWAARRSSSTSWPSRPRPAPDPPVSSVTAPTRGPTAADAAAPQQIPRPPGVRAGGPPPWADLAADERRVTARPVCGTRFAALGPGRCGRPARARSIGPRRCWPPLYEDDGETWIILTRRSAALRVHSGEVSFPGGGQDPGEDLRDTARREACEEVGLDPGLGGDHRRARPPEHHHRRTRSSSRTSRVLAGRPELAAQPGRGGGGAPRAAAASCSTRPSSARSGGTSSAPIGRCGSSSWTATPCGAPPPRCCASCSASSPARSPAATSATSDLGVRLGPGHSYRT